MIGRVIPAALVVASLATVACQRAEQAQEEMPAAEPVMPQVAQPDTTAAALWAHLEQARYQTWAMWPGKGRLYNGTEPHGMRLTTYVNALGLDAVTNKAGTMPAGAIVVKENYMPDSTLAAVTVMYKAAAGYDAANNNWFWMKRNADGTVEAQGRVPMCAGCHAQKKANDYIVTGPLK